MKPLMSVDKLWWVLINISFLNLLWVSVMQRFIFPESLSPSLSLSLSQDTFSHRMMKPSIFLKTFVATRCSTLYFIGSQFTSLNFLVPIWCLELSFWQKRIHIFWVTCIFFLISLIKGTKKHTHSESVVELKSYTAIYNFYNYE